MGVSDKRNNTFDIAKGIGMLCVIAGHMDIGVVNTVVFSFHMPLFFIISGFFTKKEDQKLLVQKKAKRLIIPYIFTCFLVILFSVLINLIERNYHQVLPDVVQWLVASIWGSGSRSWFIIQFPQIGAIWFLLALFWAFIIFNTIIDTEYEGLISLSLFLIAIIISRFIWLPWSVLAGLSAVLFLHLGHFLKKSRYLDGFVPVEFITCILVWCTCVIVNHGYYMEMVKCNYPCIPADILSGLSGSCLVIFFSMLFDKIGGVRNILSWYGRNSLIAMCFHLIEANTIPWNKILGPLCIQNQWIYWIILFLMKVLWSVIAIKAVTNIPFLRKVYGLR